MKTLSRSRLTLLPILCLVFINGCERFRSKTPEEERKLVKKEIGFGKYAGRTYTNDYFNLKVTVPEGWHIATQAEMDQHYKQGLEKFPDQDPKSRNAQSAKARTMNLLIISKHKQGADFRYEWNYVLGITTKRIADFKIKMRSGHDFLLELKKQFKMIKLNATYGPIQSGYRIGKIPAYRMKVSIDNLGLKGYQYYYCAIVNDYALLANMTYVEDEELKELEAIFNSIEASF